MVKQVELAVRPGETVRFPGRCVACGEQAVAWLPVVKRKGQTTRSLEAPVCAECARQSQRRSGREEQLRRISWLTGGLAAVGLFGLGWVLTGGTEIVLWRLAAGLALAAAGVALVWWAFQRAIRAAALPEKRAVTEAVQIASFSGRTMTLTFAREEYATTVAELNQPDQVTEPLPDPSPAS